jgi:hypothetical protein
MQTLRICEITGLNTLAGKIAGVRDWPKFLQTVEATPEGAVLVFDWADVELVTASYYSATFVRLLRMAMSGDLDRYFILINLNRTSVDELKLVLEFQGLVALIGKLGPSGNILEVEILGNLDSVYSEAYEAVRKSTQVSASQLYGLQRQASAGIGKTGWINRLANLHRLRLVKRQKIGREFVFEAIK